LLPLSLSRTDRTDNEPPEKRIPKKCIYLLSSKVRETNGESGRKKKMSRKNPECK
jgi:hypothetical protein